MSPLSKAMLAVFAVSLAANLALLARRFGGTGSAAAPTSQVAGAAAPGQAVRGRVVGGQVPPPRLKPQDCASAQAAGEAALAALRRDVERHTPADAKWKRASANAALTATLATGVAAARPDVPRDAFAVECRAAVCRLTTSDDAVLASLIATPYLRRMAGKPRWGERSVTFETLPEDTVDGLSYLRELSAQIEARGLLAPCSVSAGTGRQRVPVRLALTDETESLDRPGIELTVGTISGNLELTACVERILRAHLETLAMPAHVSGATFFSYFHLSKP